VELFTGLKKTKTFLWSDLKSLNRAKELKNVTMKMNKNRPGKEHLIVTNDFGPM